MPGLLDDLQADDTTKDEFGQTQADRRQPIWSGLIKAGLLGVAAGGDLMPADRARMVAQMGGAVGDIPNEMMQYRAGAAQQTLRGQQIATAKSKLDNIAKLQALAKSPEFLDSIKDLKPHEKIAMQAAIDAGDIDAFAKITGQVGTGLYKDQQLDIARQRQLTAEERTKLAEEKSNRPKVDPATGIITHPNGDVDIMDPLTYEPRPYMRGGQYVKPGQPQPQPNPQPNAQPQPPVVPPDASSPDIEARTRAADAEIKGWSDPAQAPNTPVLPAVTVQAPKFGNYDEDYLKTLPPQIQSEVKQIAEYDRKPYSTSGVRGGLELKRNRMIMDAVSAYTKGTYTEGDFANRNFVKKQYGPGGTIGNNMISIATAHNHLGTLYDLGGALATGDSSAVNAAVDKYRRLTGNDKVTSFDTARLAVSDELAKAMKGANISDTEIAEWKNLISSASRPEQIQAVIETAQHLLQGRTTEVLDAYERRMKQPYGSFLSQQALDKQAEIKANPLGKKTAAATPGGGGAPTPQEIAAEMARRRAAGQK